MFKKSSLGLGTKIGAAANKPDLNVGCYATRIEICNVFYVYEKKYVLYFSQKQNKGSSHIFLELFEKFEEKTKRIVKKTFRRIH